MKKENIPYVVLAFIFSMFYYVDITLLILSYVGLFALLLASKNKDAMRKCSQPMFLVLSMIALRAVFVVLFQFIDSILDFADVYTSFFSDFFDVFDFIILIYFIVFFIVGLVRACKGKELFLYDKLSNVAFGEKNKKDDTVVVEKED